MRVIGLDTETHLIKRGCIAPRLVCLTTSDGTPSGDRRIYGREDGLRVARELLQDPDVHLAIHNFGFDLCVLAAEDPSFLPLIFSAIDAGRIHCTLIRQKIIDNALGNLKYEWDEENNEFKKQRYRLFDLVMRHFGYDIAMSKSGDDVWRLRYAELDGIPVKKWPADAINYAIDDAVWHRKVFEAQEDYCAPHGLPGGTQGEIWQTQAAWALYLMGAWGVRTDGEAVARLKAEVTKDYRRVVEVAQRFKLIRRGAKESRNMAAIRDAIEDWYNEHELPIKYTEGGTKGNPQIATDREQLTDVECECGYAFKQHPHAFDEASEQEGVDDGLCRIDGIHRGLWAVAEVVRLQKLLKTYIAALERGTEVPLCPSYNVMVESFRTSCSQGMKIDGVPIGIQLQNPPRKGGVRECFVPREGSVFVFCDYDTLEMLTLAQVCIELFGYSKIAEAAWEGLDFHLAFAANMMGIPYKQANERLKAGDAAIADARQFCKIGNYGFAGGMGARTFVAYAKGYGENIPMSTARQLHAGFRQIWPEMEDYFRYVANLVGDGRRAKVVQCPRSKLMRGEVTYSATANHFFQHRAAMGAKDATQQVIKECYLPELESPLFGCRGWLFAHDEDGIEVPYEGQRASDAAQRLQTVMVDKMREWCPDVPIGATAVMHRRWFKGGKAMLVDGMMVPSRPEKYVDDEGKTKTRWVADV